MTRQSRMNKKRAIAFMLTGLFMVQQTMALSVFAAGVVSSGVTGTAMVKVEQHITLILLKQMATLVSDNIQTSILEPTILQT